ncbi:MAG: 2-amino-4-hydroxy-6-hydroxymethyldihydropteridine diphosphokinase [Myxococcales bacterium]
MAELTHVVGMGANLGSRAATLRAAVARIEHLAGATLEAVAPVYESAAVGPPQPDYLNSAVRLRCAHSPPELLPLLLQVEQDFGRERRERWGARTLDLDILWSEQPCEQPGLSVPHARLRERWFALAPLLDVAPELSPVYGPALRALGGAPAPGTPLLLQPRVERTRGEGTLSCRAVDPDPLQALADALTGLCRAFAQCTTAPPQKVEVVEVVRSDPDPAALARAVLQRAARGLSTSHVTVLALRGQHAEARLLGAPAPAAPAPDVSLHRTANGGAVRFEVGARF